VGGISRLKVLFSFQPEGTSGPPSSQRDKKWKTVNELFQTPWTFISGLRQEAVVVKKRTLRRQNHNNCIKYDPVWKPLNSPIAVLLPMERLGKTV